MRMKVLNIEDNAFKHNDICKVLKKCGITEIDWARNLEDGVKRIETQIEKDVPYDVVITDMWYPAYPGGADAASGEELIRLSKEKGWNLGIILCSSVHYRINGILGSVHYSERSDWESEIVALINRMK